MPYIRVTSMSEDQVKKLSLSLAKKLAPIMSTDEDNFTIERISSQFFRSGNLVQENPLIEIFWFDRGQEVQNQSALKVTEIVKQICDSEYVTVIFTPWAKTAYYENGKHF